MTRSGPERLEERSSEMLLCGALAFPALCLVAAALFSVASGVLGVNPLWRSPELNMSEAAAMRDPATVVRMLRDGADQGLRRGVRPGLLFDRSVQLTPLEAAIAARRPEIVVALITQRRFDREQWNRLRCLVASSPDGDVERVVEEHRPEGAAAIPDCSGVNPPWDGLARR